MKLEPKPRIARGIQAYEASVMLTSPLRLT